MATVVTALERGEAIAGGGGGGHIAPPPLRRRSARRSVFDLDGKKFFRVIRSLSSGDAQQEDADNVNSRGISGAESDHHLNSFDHPHREYTPEKRRPSDTFTGAFAVRSLTEDGGGGNAATGLHVPCDDAEEVLSFPRPRRPVGSDAVPWYITTRKLFVRRGVGERLGMVVCSDAGRYGTRVDTVKPGGAAEAAGVLTDDIFIKVCSDYVLHCDHEQFVKKLSTLPLCFAAEVCESFQMPTTVGKYVITVREPRLAGAQGQGGGAHGLAAPAARSVRRSSPTLQLPGCDSDAVTP